MIERIVSGGQTGVDRAALDVALRLGVPCGGWCPRGRLAEDGPISQIYPLDETPASDYAERTEWNVRDSDGTLILCQGPLSGGTAFTAYCARKLGRPFIVVDLAAEATVAPVLDWVRQHRIARLNVAGPRASTAPGIHGLASQFIETLLTN